MEPELNRVSRGDESHTLEPKVMQVLVCLADRQGQVVSRRELADEIWGDVILVDGVLTRVIHLLRDIFGDDHRDPRYIETIRKGGYRLIENVVRAEREPGPDGFLLEASATHARPRREWFVGAAVLAAAMVLLLLWPALRDDSPVMPRGPTCQPLTTYSGRERHPAFSPDGNLMAFSWRSGDEDGFDIYVRQVDTDNPLRLTDHPDDEFSPVWSPNGDRLAYLRRGNEGGLFEVPALGGASRRLASFRATPRGLDWSPDGATIFFVASPPPDSTSFLCQFDLATGTTKRLTTPPPGHIGDCYPAYSPDGKSVAFVRTDQAGFQDIHLLDLASGETRRVTRGQQRVVGVSWFPDGKRLVFSGKPRSSYQLWTIDLPGGDPVWLPTRQEIAMHPVVLRDGASIVYEAVQRAVDLIQIRLDGRHELAGEPTDFAYSTAVDRDAAFSSDGTKVAFVSSRSGFPEVWICDAEGDDPRQITHFAGADVLLPAWSPDSRHVVVSVADEDQYDLIVCDVESGSRRRLRTSDSHEIVDFWSQDGRWIYFHTRTTQGKDYYRIDPEGQVFEKTGITGGELLKQVPGGALFFIARHDGSLWRRDWGAENDSLVFTSLLTDPLQEAELDSAGAYVKVGTEERTVLYYVDLTTGKTHKVMESGAMSNLVLAPEGDRLLFERHTYGCDLMKMDIPR